VTAGWQVTENRRRARIYRLTATGRRRLGAETAWWDRARLGVGRVLRAPIQER
jgi:DNA-binding PadR family transcriptional regulator